MHLTSVEPWFNPRSTHTQKFKVIENHAENESPKDLVKMHSLRKLRVVPQSLNFSF